MSDANSSLPSDYDVLQGTGRHPDEWFAFLDLAGASTWQHLEIVSWFATNADYVSADWARAVALRYAAARGRSVPE